VTTYASKIVSLQTENVGYDYFVLNPYK